MKRSVTVTVLAMLVLVGGCGPKKPTATVAFSYTDAPREPLSEQYSNITVYDATMQGDTNEYDQNKWAKNTADMVRFYLQEARERHGLPIQVVDRAHGKLALGEQDLADAGLTDDRGDIGSSGLEGIDALITSDITVKIDKQKGKRRTVDAMSVAAFAGRSWGGGGGSIRTTEVDEEARNITVSCQFQLKDPKGNRMIVSHSTRPSQEYTETKASPFFGSSKTERNMPPRDQVIGAMIEKHVLDFLGKFLPVTTVAEVVVKAGDHEMSIAGVKIMVYADSPGEFERALGLLKQAIAEKDDDHRSQFAAGVCCEWLGRIPEARRYYKQAASSKPKEEAYSLAVGRVQNRG